MKEKGFGLVILICILTLILVILTTIITVLIMTNEKTKNLEKIDRCEAKSIELYDKLTYKEGIDYQKYQGRYTNNDINLELYSNGTFKLVDEKIKVGYFTNSNNTIKLYVNIILNNKVELMSNEEEIILTLNENNINYQKNELIELNKSQILKKDFDDSKKEIKEKIYNACKNEQIIQK